LGHPSLEILKKKREEQSKVACPPSYIFQNEFYVGPISSRYCEAADEAGIAYLPGVAIHGIQSGCMIWTLDRFNIECYGANHMLPHLFRDKGVIGEGLLSPKAHHQILARRQQLHTTAVDTKSHLNGRIK
jgi:hypothetical protein